MTTRRRPLDTVTSGPHKCTVGGRSKDIMEILTRTLNKAKEERNLVIAKSEELKKKIENLQQELIATNEKESEITADIDTIEAALLVSQRYKLDVKAKKNPEERITVKLHPVKHIKAPKKDKKSTKEQPVEQEMVDIKPTLQSKIYNFVKTSMVASRQDMLRIFNITIKQLDAAIYHHNKKHGSEKIVFDKEINAHMIMGTIATKKVSNAGKSLKVETIESLSKILSVLYVANTRGASLESLVNNTCLETKEVQTTLSRHLRRDNIVAYDDNAKVYTLNQPLVEKIISDTSKETYILPLKKKYTNIVLSAIQY
jgi:hypothetical protein